MMESSPERLELTEDEAFALLGLCLTSGMPLDAESEKAVRKLAAYCKRHRTNIPPRYAANGNELCEAG